MQTVALVDWNWIGHHPTYFIQLMAGFKDAGCQVAAFCPESAIDDVRGATSALDEVTVDACCYIQPRLRLPNFIRPRDHAWRLFGNLEKSFKAWEARHRLKIDLVFFSTIYDWQFETMIHAHRCFSRPWSGIYLHARAFRMPGSFTPYFNRPPCPEKIFTHPAMSSACLIDEGAVQPMRELTRGKPAFEFPDITGTEIEMPLDGDTLSGKLLRFANGRKTVVCLGHLQKTKGLLELCKAAIHSECSDICFFFGGEVSWTELSSEEVRFIKAAWEQSPNILTHLARISDATMNALIKGSDLVFAAYTNFPNSSNIMTKAAMLERPVLVSDGHLMAERVRKHRLGGIVPEGSVQDIIKEILRLCAQGGDPKADYHGYYEKHSPEALRKALLKVVSAIP